MQVRRKLSETPQRIWCDGEGQFVFDYPPNLPDRAQQVVTRNASVVHAYGGEPAAAFLRSNRRPILIPIEWAWYHPVTGKGGERQISHALFNGMDGYYVRFGESSGDVSDDDDDDGGGKGVKKEYFLMRESDLHMRINFVASGDWYKQLQANPFRVYRVPGGAVVLRSSTRTLISGADRGLGNSQELCGHKQITSTLVEIPDNNLPQNIDDVCEDDGHCVILGLAKLLQWSVPQYYQRVEGEPNFIAVEQIYKVVNKNHPQHELKHLKNMTSEFVLQSATNPANIRKPDMRLDWGKVLFNVRLCNGNIQHYIAIDFDRREAVDAAHKGRIAFVNITEVMEALNIDSFLYTWRIVDKHNQKRKSEG